MEISWYKTSRTKTVPKNAQTDWMTHKTTIKFPQKSLKNPIEIRNCIGIFFKINGSANLYQSAIAVSQNETLVLLFYIF